MTYTLITGASSGFGERFARELAKKGHNLIIVARNKNRMDMLGDQLLKQYSIKVRVIPQDLAEINAAETIFNLCDSLNLEVDTLINNAGFGYFGEFETQDTKNIQDMIFVNILALTMLTRLFLPQLKKYKGRILNVASTGSFQPVPYFNCYSATKSYVLDFSEALGEELKGTGVSVTALAPGPTDTPFHHAMGRSVNAFIIKGPSTKKVIEAGIEGMEKRKRLVIPGMVNRLLAHSVRFTPTFLVLSLAKYFIGENK